MRLLDEHHLKHPFMGSRRLRDMLEDDHDETVKLFTRGSVPVRRTKRTKSTHTYSGD